MIFLLNMKTHAITERWLILPETQAVQDMILGADGMVYGMARPNRLFVFDPTDGKFIHDEVLSGYGKVSGNQAPRCMINGPDGAIHVLFKKAVVRLEPGTYQHSVISRPPETITSGIAIQGDNLYFGCGPSLYSCSLSTLKK